MMETKEPGRAKRPAAIRTEVREASETIPADVAEKALQVVERFRTSSRGTVKEVIEIGRQLVAVRSNMEVAAFSAWVRRELGSEHRTAENYMQLARTFAERSEIVETLPLTVAYKLAAPTLPTSIRDEILAHLSEGRPLDAATIKGMIAEGMGHGRRRRPVEREAHRGRRETGNTRSDIEAARLIAALAGSRRLELVALLSHRNRGFGLLLRQALRGELPEDEEGSPDPSHDED